MKTKDCHNLCDSLKNHEWFKMVIKHLISCFSSDQPVLIVHGKETDPWQCQLNQGAMVPPQQKARASLSSAPTWLTELPRQSSKGAHCDPELGCRECPTLPPALASSTEHPCERGAQLQELLCLVQSAWKCHWGSVSLCPTSKPPPKRKKKDRSLTWQRRFPSKENRRPPMQTRHTC